MAVPQGAMFVRVPTVMTRQKNRIDDDAAEDQKVRAWRADVNWKLDPTFS
jgi:hypothetical protein